MATLLNQVAKDTIDRLTQAMMSSYEGVTLLAPGEGLWVAPDRVRDGSPLLQLLDSVDDRPRLRATDIERMTLSFFVIGYGPDNNRVYFCARKSSAHWS